MPAFLIASSKRLPVPFEPSMTAPLPWASSAWATEPSSPSYRASSVKPKAWVSWRTAALASAYSSVGKTLGRPPSMPAMPITPL